MNWEARKYLLKVRFGLFGSLKLKKIFMSELKQNVREYLKAQPNASFLEFCNIFGSPSILADEFIRLCEYTKIKRYFSVKPVLITAMILMLMCFIISGLTIYINNHTEIPSFDLNQYPSYVAAAMRE